jgi:fucose 4-O-acetylase-like acetyltransferase
MQKRTTSVTRLPDVERAKGLAILLVVFGHVVARDAPAGNAWYLLAKQAVYSFHMAFFMFLSGFVFFLRAVPAASSHEFAVFVRKRFMRLMPAYFLFAGIVFLGKWGAESFMHVDNPVTGFNQLIGIALYPMQSVSAFLWYIYVLFLFSVVGLALLTVGKGRIWPIVIVGLVLLWMPGIPFLGLGQFTKYFLFFALGGLVATSWDSYTRWLDHYWLWTFVLFSLLLLSGYSPEAWIIPGLLSIPALHGFCRRVLPESRLLMFVGSLTFSIYLMNTMAMGLIKAILLKFTSWDGPVFVYLFFPALLLSGVLIPIFAKRVVFPRIPWLDRITN